MLEESEYSHWRVNSRFWLNAILLWVMNNNRTFSLYAWALTLGYPGRSTYPAQCHWPELGAWLPPRTEARAASCASFLWSSPYPSQKTEEDPKCMLVLCAFGFSRRAFWVPTDGLRWPAHPKTWTSSAEKNISPLCCKLAVIINNCVS